MAVDAPTLAPTLDTGAGQADVVLCFDLVLGRRPGRASDIEYHLKAPIGMVLMHILGSREFGDRVLPQVGARPAPAWALRLVAPELAQWAAGLFGREVMAGGLQWLPLLTRCLASAPFQALLQTRMPLWRRVMERLPSSAALAEMRAAAEAEAARAAEAEAARAAARQAEPPADAAAFFAALGAPAAGLDAAAAAPQEPPAPRPPPGPLPPEEVLAVTRLLFADEAPYVAQPDGYDVLMDGRLLVLSEEFAARVLAPMAEGRIPEGMLEPLPAAPEPAADELDAAAGSEAPAATDAAAGEAPAEGEATAPATAEADGPGEATAPAAPATEEVMAPVAAPAAQPPADTGGEAAAAEAAEPAAEPAAPREVLRVPLELRRMATADFIQDRLALAAVHFEEPWPRFLLRLLRHADSLLRPDAETWARAGVPANQVTRALGRIDAAFAGMAALDPLLRVPAFTAASDVRGAEALFRFMLGRAPSPRDNLKDMARRGYPATLLRLIASPEFDRTTLAALRAGRPPRHAAESGLDSGHFALLAEILGCPADPPLDWARTLTLTLGDPALLAALGALPAETPLQEEARDYVTAALTRLREDLLAPPAPRVLVELREDRNLHVTIEGIEAAPGERLLVDLDLVAPEPLRLTAEAAPDEAGRLTAMLTLPVLAFEPHAWSGSLGLALAGDSTDDAREVGHRLPVRVAFNPPELNRIRTRLNDEARRARTMADTGRRRDALGLIERLPTDIRPFTEPRLLAVTLAALEGDYAAAEAQLAAMDLPSHAAAELRGRLALRQGRFEEAAACFAEAPPAEGILAPALDLLAAACAPGDDLPPVALTEQIRQETLRLLRDVTAPALPLAAALCGAAALPGRAEYARDVALALALGFAPPASLGEFLRELDAQGVLPALAFLQNPEVRRLRHLFLPALGALQPARLSEAELVFAVGRTLFGDGRAEEAMRFVELGVRLAPRSFDGQSLAAQVARRVQGTDQAVAHLQQALALKPDDARTIERLLAYEIDALKQDPLRHSERYDSLLDSLMEAQQRALLKAPRDPEVRLEYARFAVMAENYDEATTILLASGAEALSGPAIQLLIRIGQLRNDNAGVLEWFARLQPEDVDERSVVSAVKAHRALGGVEAAQALLEAHLETGGPALRREYVRNLFFAARFEDAAQEAARLIALDPADLELRMLAAAADLELGRNVTAYYHTAWVQMHGGAKQYPLEMPLFLYAALHRNGDREGALAQLDPMFARVGAQPVRLDPRLGAETFDQLAPTGLRPADAGANPPVFDGPKVSVVMTTWNVQDYVRTAVRSILQQTYRNFELIIVDDASTDATPEILAALERSDPRIKLILKSTNDGTYVSKNLGLLQAQGEFAAFQDSDDWSHPDRLACSVGVLMRRPEIVGLTTDWLRMTTGGDIVIKAGGQISHVCCISLVFRRKPVLAKVGFFDSVRIAADLELIQRMGLAFGSKNVPRLRWPLLFGRARSDSLTASEEFGLSRTGFTEPRELYHRHADAFHEKIAAGGSAYIPFPLGRRLFDAPAIILPTKGAA